jgi:hypothetical protein
MEETKPEKQTTGNEQQANDERISSGETITDAEQPETNNQQTATENMEVHHHSHAHGKKNWKAYFWEFLMLFLAVFCGFLAEYQLEHTIEHQREKTYISSLAVDIKSDIATFDTLIKRNEALIKSKDTMVQITATGSVAPEKVELYYDLLWSSIGYPTHLTLSKRTITQLLNAGGLRLIRKKNVSDAISDYITAVDYLERVRQQTYIDWSYKSLFASKEITDVLYMQALPQIEYKRAPYNNPVLKSTSKELIKDFAFIVEMDKENNITYINDLIKSRNEAEKLLALMQNEYHLE